VLGGPLEFVRALEKGAEDLGVAQLHPGLAGAPGLQGVVAEPPVEAQGFLYLFYFTNDRLIQLIHRNPPPCRPSSDRADPGARHRGD
jgi:hypothetical protein